MKDELTDEQIEDAILNGALKGTITLTEDVKILARALKSERAKPKVWDGVPDDAKECHGVYFRGLGDKTGVTRVWVKELPKTIEQEIAEKWKETWYKNNGRTLEQCIEDALKEYGYCKRRGKYD